MRIHPASGALTRIELFFHDVALGHATGFLYSYGQELALVSNWHVFSGRNPLTKQVTDNRGYKPNRVKFHVTEAQQEKAGISLFFREMDLYLVEGGQSQWWQHPGYMDDQGAPQLVDIGVLPLSGKIQNFSVMHKVIQSFDAQFIVTTSANPDDWTYQQGTVGVGSEVFILGYPMGLANQGVLPVWKRGSLASEPLFHIQGNIPVIYVDALTRHGMSGSPVIAINQTIIDESGRRTQIGGEAGGQPWVIGVYAGRRGSTGDELEMALGRVWKRSLLDFIFFEHEPGGSEPRLAG